MLIPVAAHSPDSSRAPHHHRQWQCEIDVAPGDLRRAWTPQQGHVALRLASFLAQHVQSAVPGVSAAQGAFVWGGPQGEGFCYGFTECKADESPAAYLLRQARQMLSEARAEGWLTVMAGGRAFDLSHAYSPLLDLHVPISQAQFMYLCRAYGTNTMHHPGELAQFVGKLLSDVLARLLPAALEGEWLEVGPLLDQPIPLALAASPVPPLLQARPQGVTPEMWAVAQGRYALIEPLLDPEKHRDQAAVARVAHESGKHPTTIYRWIFAFERTRRLEALLPLTRSDRGSHCLAPEVDAVIQDVLERRPYADRVKNVQALYQEVEQECQERGLEAPHVNTFRRRVAEQVGPVDVPAHDALLDLPLWDEVEHGHDA